MKSRSVFAVFASNADMLSPRLFGSYLSLGQARRDADRVRKSGMFERVWVEATRHRPGSLAIALAMPDPTPAPTEPTP